MRASDFRSFDEDRHCLLEGPDGFAALATTGWIELRHRTRWRDFLRDPVIENALTELVRVIARNFSSHAILYLPQDWAQHLSARAREQLYDADLAQLQELLLHEWGPPAADLRGIYSTEAQAWVAGGYHVDVLIPEVRDHSASHEPRTVLP